MQQNLIEIYDDYEHLDSTLEYVLENVLQDSDADNCTEYKNLYNQYNSALVNKCECCHSAMCNDKECIHGGNYKKDHNTTELVLNTKAELNTIYECSALCKCDRNACENRLVQYGPRKNLIVIDSERYGSKGLITTKNIPCGGFICEYAGELLTRQEASRRTAENESIYRMNYILFLNEMSQDKEGSKLTTIVDPSRRGNIGRYLNHSCDPNCQIYSVRVDCPVPKIGIFANRQILAGEELCFHYGGEENHHKIYKAEHWPNVKGTSCLCGTGKCAKILPYKDFL